MTKAAPSFGDLIGVPHERLDCYGLVRVYMHRHGIELPIDPALCLLETGEIFDSMPMRAAGLLKAGDVLRMTWGDGTDHVGVAVDAFRFLHTTKGTGSRVDRIAPWVRSVYAVLKVKRREGVEA